MSYYKKAVSYIDLFENGNRVKNIGYIKTEVRNEIWKLNVYLKGLPPTDTLMCEIKAVGTQKHLGSFRVERGVGSFRQEFDADEFYFNSEGLNFLLSPKRYGVCTWEREEGSGSASKNAVSTVKAADSGSSAYNVAQKRAQTGKQQVIDKEEVIQRNPEDKRKIQRIQEKEEAIIQNPASEKTMQRAEGTPSMPELQIPRAPGDRVENLWGEAPVRQPQNKNAKTVERTQPEARESARGLFTDGREQNISGDKWQQLGALYPVLRPFKETVQGEFLSIKPGDFVVLSEHYQSMANNSFLLHGFYNYHHIILGRKTVDGVTKYYIGVPGIYHEREIKVAIMFGFEAFEGTEGEEIGAFGYYMKEVRI